MTSQSDSQPPALAPTSEPPAPLSPDDTINNDPTDPSFDPSSLDQDIDMAIDPSPDPQLPNTQLDGPPDDPSAGLENGDEDIKLPLQKDISLREFLEKMDDYTPIIPDAVTSHHLLLAGLPPSTIPLPLSRLLALATQKFIADVAADAYQYSRMRASGTTTASNAASNLLNPTGGALGAGTAGGGAVGGTAGGGPTQGPTQGGDGTAKGKAGAHVFGTQRAGYGGGGGGSSGRAVLTMEDLGCAVGEYGVNVKRAEFYR
ncbi:MAG: hypothetical protein L6R41_005253 [Letrouitia leprolyta]|nr:MAG: hypothetical protein L6R41_005253 [Letrouitia leprolyta]